LVRAFRCSSSSDSRILSRIGIIDLLEVLQVHPNTLRAWDNKGYLKAVRLGARGDRRYKKSKVMKIVEGKHAKNQE